MKEISDDLSHVFSNVLTYKLTTLFQSGKTIYSLKVKEGLAEQLQKIPPGVKFNALVLV